MLQIGLSAKTPRELLMKAGELLGEHKKMKDKVKRLEKEVKHLEKHKGQYSHVRQRTFSVLEYTIHKHNRLAQLVECRTTVREVVGSNPGRTNTQDL